MHEQPHARRLTVALTRSPSRARPRCDALVALGPRDPDSHLPHQAPAGIHVRSCASAGRLPPLCNRRALATGWNGARNRTPVSQAAEAAASSARPARVPTRRHSPTHARQDAWSGYCCSTWHGFKLVQRRAGHADVRQAPAQGHPGDRRRAQSCATDVPCTARRNERRLDVLPGDDRRRRLITGHASSRNGAALHGVHRGRLRVDERHRRRSGQRRCLPATTTLFMTQGLFVP